MRTLRDLLGVELSAVSKREKLISAIGGVISIFCLIFISSWCLELPHATAVVASMGASAVLLFGVPHGQLSQPWPVLAGHFMSAIIGVACAKWIPHQELAAACAVGISIGAMHQFKCIHPPGGATALTAVLGGGAIRELGWKFAFCPVLVNGVTMVAIAIAFNLFFGWRRYPAALVKPTHVPRPGEPTHEEIVSALRELDSFVDVSEDDLIRLCEILSDNKKQRQRA